MKGAMESAGFSTLLPSVDRRGQTLGGAKGQAWTVTRARLYRLKRKGKDKGKTPRFGIKGMDQLG